MVRSAPHDSFPGQPSGASCRSIVLISISEYCIRSAALHCQLAYDQTYNECKRVLHEECTSHGLRELPTMALCYVEDLDHHKLAVCCTASSQSMIVKQSLSEAHSFFNWHSMSYRLKKLCASLALMCRSFAENGPLAMHV